MSNKEKAEKFIKEVKRLLNNNYTTLDIAEDFLNGITISESSNSIITSIYIKPNKYNESAIEKEELQKRCEEIASLANGMRPNWLTKTDKYPDYLRILTHKAARDYPIVEIEFKYLNPDY